MSSIPVIDGDKREELQLEHLVIAILQAMPPASAAAVIETARRLNDAAPRHGLNCNRVAVPHQGNGGIVRPSGGA